MMEMVATGGPLAKEELRKAGFAQRAEEVTEEDRSGGGKQSREVLSLVPKSHLGTQLAAQLRCSAAQFSEQDRP